VLGRLEKFVARLQPAAIFARQQSGESPGIFNEGEEEGEIEALRVASIINVNGCRLADDCT
jgi:hypothetical protein